MKRSLLPAFITALLGFAAGWLLKPDPAPSAADFAKKSGASTPHREHRPENPTPPPAAADPQPENPPVATIPHTNPLAAANQRNTAAAAKSRDDAKLSRLVETLHLSQQQQDDLLKIIADAQAAATPVGGSASTLDPAQIIPTAAGTGAAIEKALAALLNPDQAAAFAALRQRSLDNTLEATAQTQLAENLQQIDLTPEQRAQALARLRDATAAKLAARPPGLDLALDTSVLPIGSGAFAAEALESAQNLADFASDPAKAQQEFLNRGRAQLDAQLDLYKDILTPAQQAQLKTRLEAHRSAISRYEEIIK